MFLDKESSQSALAKIFTPSQPQSKPKEITSNNLWKTTNKTYSDWVTNLTYALTQHSVYNLTLYIYSYI